MYCTIYTDRGQHDKNIFKSIFIPNLVIEVRTLQTYHWIMMQLAVVATTVNACTSQQAPQNNTRQQQFAEILNWKAGKSVKKKK